MYYVALAVCQQAHVVQPRYFQCWPTVCDAGPTLVKPKRIMFAVLMLLVVFLLLSKPCTSMYTRLLHHNAGGRVSLTVQAVHIDVHASTAS